MFEQQKAFDAHALLAPGSEEKARLLAVMDSCVIDRAIVVAGGGVFPDTLPRQLVEGGTCRLVRETES